MQDSAIRAKPSPASQEPLGAIETVIFNSPVVRIGLFRCPISYPSFADTGLTSDHLLVFPRTSVQITHAGRHTIVADPNTVMLYNRQQHYLRTALSPRGDLCEWFAFNPALLQDALRSVDPAVDDRPDRPFQLTHVPSMPEAYLAQRLVVQYVLQHGHVDQFFVEEALLKMLAQVIRVMQRASDRFPQQVRPPRANDTRAVVHAAQSVIGLHFQEALTLSEIAQAVHISPFHLARIFLQHTGYTMHAYLNRLRLSSALEQIAQNDTNLAHLAVEYGYSSHSHFTTAFRQLFGMSPTTYRATASARSIREMRNLLKV